MQQVSAMKQQRKSGYGWKIAGTMLLTALLGGTLLGAQSAGQLHRIAGTGKLRAQTTTSTSNEATNTSIVNPGGVAYDASGNLYISDTNNNRILKVDLGGLATVIGGNGSEGFSGDQGSATSAEFDLPMGLAVDASGAVYVADSNNNRIRRIANGVVTTVAGSGANAWSGDGGSATAASLSSPNAVAVDASGNLYIADTGNSCIRKVSGGVISTVAGNGMQGFSGDGGPATEAMLNAPAGLAVDASGNLYISDSENHRVRRVDASSGRILTVAGNGSDGFDGDGVATSHELSSPQGIAIDGSGFLYIADTGNQRIRQVSNGNITTLAGNGNQGSPSDAASATATALNNPQTVAVFANQLAIADSSNNEVQAVTGGAVNTVAGNQPTAEATLQIGSITSTIYGSGSLSATWSKSSEIASGTVDFYDGTGSSATLIGSSPLSGNVASIATTTLSAGIHSIVARYMGDSKNSALASGVYGLTILQRQVTATPKAATMLYGDSLPVLSGSASGILDQDADKVSVKYQSSASAISTPGKYPITATLLGSSAGNYSVVVSATAGGLTVSAAPTTTTLSIGTKAPIYQAALTLTAKVQSSSAASAAGTVNFMNGTTLLNATPIAVTNGSASLTTTSLPLGALALTAIYTPNADFVQSSSAVLTATNLSPEFTLTAKTTSASLAPSNSVDYSFALSPVNGSFVYDLTLSASGLPDGVTATFSPATLSTGSPSGNVTMTLTASSAALASPQRGLGGSMLKGMPLLALLILPLAMRRSSAKVRGLLKAQWILLPLAMLTALLSLSACGGSGFFSHPVKSYTVTVQAVSGPVTKTVPVTLTLQ